ncbi:MAG: ferrochelatase [Pirellulales bacterium]
MTNEYDAVLVLSFGGPERRDEVMPFLERVLRGRRVPRERMLEVAEHYYELGGASPANAQSRGLVAALREELDKHGPHLPIYWGNRNWHPLLADTLQQMADAGIRRTVAWVTSAYSSYSGCRQYLEDIERARAEVGDEAPQVDKLRVCYNHPGFIDAMVDRVNEVFDAVPADHRATAKIVFTAHSIPQAMASGCSYEAQLDEACQLVAERLGPNPWQLVYQSRSGAPGQPWLEPDIADFVRTVDRQEVADGLVVVPIGFLSDHMEVLYDLDTEVCQICDERKVPMLRAKTVGTHPRMVTMIRQLITERTSESPQRLAVGRDGPSHDVCPADCCPLGRP